MPKAKENKDKIDHADLIERYGKHEAPDFAHKIKKLLSKPNPNAPAKTPKR